MSAGEQAVTIVPTIAPSERKIARDEWRRGWPVVIGGMIGIGSGPGLYQNVSSLFNLGMMTEFGWTRGDIATAAGLGLLGALAAPLVGRLVDRIGVRIFIVSAMLLLGLAYVGLSRMTGPLWQLRVLIAALALSVPGTSAIIYGRLIATAFVIRRGTALGVVFSGLSLLTIIVPPLLALVIAAAGWRGGFLALAAFTSIVALPLVMLAIRRVPSRVSGSSLATTVAGVTCREARRTTNFWLLAVGVMLINMATVGLVSQLVPFGMDHGFAATTAALLLTSFGASQIAGRIIIGVLIDRFAPQIVAAAAALVSAAGFVLLQIQAPSFMLLMAAVFIAGIMVGAENDLLPFFTLRLFGLKAYSETYGTLLMLSLFGTSIGVVGYGRLHDATGSYSLPLGIALVGILLASMLFLSLGKRRSARLS